MAYDDDLPPLTKPAHVEEEEWAARLGDYIAALAVYNRTLTGVSDHLHRGERPTDDEWRAERIAHDLLADARAALLELCRHTTASRPTMSAPRRH